MVPGPEHDDIYKCSGSLLLHGMDGYLINQVVNYRFVKSYFVPGHLHWPFVPLVHSRKEFKPLQEKTNIEYVVRAIKEVDPPMLKEMYNYRGQRLQKISIYGEPYWIFISLDQTEKARKEGKGKLDLAKVLFWKNHPNILDGHVESVIGAIYEDDRWQSVMSIPRRLCLKKLTMVSVRTDGNRPAIGEIKEDVKPRIDYFIYLSNPYDSGEIRWSNDMLVEAKNTTFPEDLLKKIRIRFYSYRHSLKKRS